MESILNPFTRFLNSFSRCCVCNCYQGSVVPSHSNDQISLGEYKYLKLSNMNNSCYISSAIQLLYYMNFITNEKLMTNKSANKQSHFLEKLFQLFDEKRSNSMDEDWAQLLSLIYEEFSLEKGMKGDAAKLVEHMINRFDELHSLNKKLLEIKTNIKITGCNECDDQLYSSLGIVYAGDDSSDSVFEKELYSQIEYNDVCEHSQHIHRKCAFNTLPDLLVIYLNSTTSFLLKNSNLSLSEDKKIKKYTLVGMAVHLGDLSNGHYITFVRRVQKISEPFQFQEWIRFDDDFYSTVDEVPNFNVQLAVYFCH